MMGFQTSNASLSHNRIMGYTRWQLKSITAIQYHLVAGIRQTKRNRPPHYKYDLVVAMRMGTVYITGGASLRRLKFF
jgi:hypothetical protein